MIILDTNVISELMDRNPAPKVVAWADRQRRDQLITTSVCVMEINAGIIKLKPGRRRRELAALADWAIDDVLGGRILNFDRKSAVEAATWHGACLKQGRTIETADAMIAGIALARRIPIATRNVDHFEGLAVKVINPWDFSA
jgi:toxin FitB